MTREDEGGGRGRGVQTAWREGKSRKVRAASISVASNTFLLTLKIAVGLYIGSISVISEGVHSGMDLMAAVIALLAVRAASEPADEEHPYGHGKFESVSGTVEAVLIFGAALIIIYEAGLRLIHVEEVTRLDLGLGVMLVSIVVNVVVSRILMKVARETDSVALEADALHLSTDVWTSVGVLVGLGVIWATGFHYLDPVIAIAVAVVIMKAAYDLTRKTFGELTDRRLPPDDTKKIEKVLDEHDYLVHDYHDLRTRKAGPYKHVDLRLVVSRELDLVQTHKLTEGIEEAIEEMIPNVHVLIHTEPCHGKCETCDQQEICKELRRSKWEALGYGGVIPPDMDTDELGAVISRSLHDHEEVLSFHAVDVVATRKGMKVTLHVLVRPGTGVERSHEINHDLEEGIAEDFGDLEVIAHIEPCNGECGECEHEECPERKDRTRR